MVIPVYSPTKKRKSGGIFVMKLIVCQNISWVTARYIVPNHLQKEISVFLIQYGLKSDSFFPRGEHIHLQGILIAGGVVFWIGIDISWNILVSQYPDLFVHFFPT